MSGKYVELATVATGYAKRMNRLSARIFGEPTRPTKPRNMKIVHLLSEKPVNKRPEIVDYYPRVPEIGWMMYNLRQYGLFRDEHRDFNEEIERTRILRGKKPRVGFKNNKKKNESETEKK